MDDNQLLEVWQIHDRINVYLLDAVDAESLSSHSASKGRSAGEQFAHIHNLRLMWLKAAAQDLLKVLAKSEIEQANANNLVLNWLNDAGKENRTRLPNS